MNQRKREIKETALHRILLNSNYRGKIYKEQIAEKTKEFPILALKQNYKLRGLK